jgi:ribosomal protein S18
MGTWKLNLAKSKYAPPAQPPRSQTITIAPSGSNGVKVTVQGVAADGTNTKTEYSGSYDGKEYPYVTTGPNAVSGQTVVMRRIDAKTTERTTYLAGKKLATLTRVISPDGKTMTNTQTGTNASGQAVNNVTVYDKQ